MVKGWVAEHKTFLAHCFSKSWNQLDYYMYYINSPACYRIRLDIIIFMELVHEGNLD